MSTTPTSVESDSVLEAFRLYVEDENIQFKRSRPSYYHGGRERTQYYTYYTASRELWRVYSRTKLGMRLVAHPSGARSYIRAYGLQPIWPKHLRVDEGL